MFASQLLRILQTLPADAIYEPRYIDATDLKMRAMEKHYKKADSLSFNTKELLHSIDRRKVEDPLTLHTRERDEFLNSPELEHSKLVDDLIINENCGNRVSSIKDDPTEDLYYSNRIEKVAHALTSDEEDTDELWNPPKLECPLIMDQNDNPNKYESRLSSAPFVTTESFHEDKNVFTEKNELEYELPELMVCYNEVNYHVVKDILVDDGIAVEDNVLADRHSGTSTGHPLSLPSIEHATNGPPKGLDFELLIHHESKASPKLDPEKLQSAEEKGSMSSIINKSKSLFVEEEKENKRGPNPEIVTRVNEKNATKNKENGGLFEESIITSALPLKKFGTRSFLRSFMDSFDDNDGDIAVQHLNQNMKKSLQILDVDSEVEDSDQGSTENNLIYNSKVENGIITFDFCSSEPTEAVNKGTSDPFVSEKSLGENDLLYHNDLNSNNSHAGLVVEHAETKGKTKEESVLDLEFMNPSNPFMVSEEQLPVMDESSVSIHQESLLENKEGHLNNPFVEVQSNTTDVSSEETPPTTIASPEKDIFNPFKTDVKTDLAESMKGNNSNNPFVVSEVQNAKMDKSSESNHHQPVLSSKIAQTSNPFAPSEVQSSSTVGSLEKSHQHPQLKQKKGNSTSNNPFAISEIEISEMARTSPNVSTEIVHVESFEASFSEVSGQIPDSGPITSSGSTSLNSDSSSTSMRSFAFPVLQCEWNDSPEKFGKAKKGDLSKHRGRWKQGAWRALCCSGRLAG